MTVPRVFVQLTLLAVICLGPFVTEAVSLQQAQAASITESGLELSRRHET